MCHCHRGECWARRPSQRGPACLLGSGKVAWLLLTSGATPGWVRTLPWQARFRSSWVPAGLTETEGVKQEPCW